ncbi:MAG: guanylate kinase [Acidaminococcaceae bacterium]
MKPQGILLVLSGPSGAGKGTICQRLREKRPDIAYSVSATTRSPRTGEVAGVNYFFTDRTKFQQMIAQGELLEYAEVYDNYYGTPKAYVLDLLNQGLDVVLEIDPQGALQIKQSYPDGVFVFIVPPSLDELSKRIYKRGTDSEEVIKRRLSSATAELAYASKYDYIIVNDEVEKATSKVSNIMDAERNRAVRTFFIVNEICRNGVCRSGE